MVDQCQVSVLFLIHDDWFRLIHSQQVDYRPMKVEGREQLIMVLIHSMWQQPIGSWSLSVVINCFWSCQWLSIDGRQIFNHMFPRTWVDNDWPYFNMHDSSYVWLWLAFAHQRSGVWMLPWTQDPSPMASSELKSLDHDTYWVLRWWHDHGLLTDIW